MVAALGRLAEHPDAYGKAFNLGGTQEVSIQDLAKRVMDLWDSPSTISLIPYERAYSSGYEDMRRRVPDNTKARTLVGFNPTITIDQIIANVATSSPAGMVRNSSSPQLTGA